MLSKQALDEYREIYRAEHGNVPSDEILAEEAIKLLTVFDCIYRPVKKEWFHNFEQERNHDGFILPQQDQVPNDDEGRDDGEGQPEPISAEA